MDGFRSIRLKVDGTNGSNWAVFRSVASSPLGPSTLDLTRFGSHTSETNSWGAFQEPGCPKDWIPIDFPDNHGLKFSVHGQPKVTLGENILRFSVKSCLISIFAILIGFHYKFWILKSFLTKFASYISIS